MPQLAGAVALARTDTPEGTVARAGLRNLIEAPDGNTGGGFSAVECIDYSQRLSRKRQVALTRSSARLAPWFGGVMTLTYARGCEGLHLKSDPIPNMKSMVNRDRVSRVKPLISNATADTETPLIWANAMARAFPKAFRVGYLGAQHIIWNTVPSTCVDTKIDRYMLTTKLPKRLAPCPFVPDPHR